MSQALIEHVEQMETDFAVLVHDLRHALERVILAPDELGKLERLAEVFANRARVMFNHAGAEDTASQEFSALVKSLRSRATLAMRDAPNGGKNG